VASHLRSEGYFTDFWGRGFGVAEKMGWSCHQTRGLRYTKSFGLSAGAGGEPAGSMSKSFVLGPMAAM